MYSFVDFPDQRYKKNRLPVIFLFLKN